MTFSKHMQEPSVGGAGREKAVWSEKRQRGRKGLDQAGPFSHLTASRFSFENHGTLCHLRTLKMKCIPLK